MGSHVFICYPRERENDALALAAHLSSQGVRYWLDLQQLDLRHHTASKIAEGIAAAQAVYLLVPEDGELTCWMRFELILSRLLNKIVIKVDSPFRLQSVPGCPSRRCELSERVNIALKL